MDIAITRMSSKGQVVIPADMRKDIQEGDKIVIIKNDHQLIMKKATNLDKNLAEDLEFAKRTEEALIRYEKSEFNKRESKDFLKDLARW